MASSDVDEKYPPLTYYPDRFCETCRRLDKTEMKPQPDDQEYVFDYENFRDDETLRLHVINYRRIQYTRSYFDIDCPPNYGGVGGQPHPGKHYANDDKFQKTVEECARFGVQKCNEETKVKGIDLEFVEVLNVTAEGCGWMRFYMTLACRNRVNGKRKGISEAGGDTSDDCVIQSYRVVVSCSYWDRKEKKMLLFKDPNGKHLWEPADPFCDRVSEPYYGDKVTLADDGSLIVVHSSENKAQE
ncbi:unnamed protein product [Linum tenue]|uniref:Uncharacterized protein n=1 Tax=Linum tenue TaxID=586396 RepID=A0AAV0JGC5_9ROSI|nr:unnamed protein product [Linum tenue]CAI0407851.1 unnamed protein product [Linum tenue]